MGGGGVLCCHYRLKGSHSHPQAPLGSCVGTSASVDVLEHRFRRLRGPSVISGVNLKEHSTPIEKKHFSLLTVPYP